MLTTREQLLNESLVNITNELDLPETSYKIAIERYQTIGNYLGNEKSILSEFSPKIYSQGSFRLGTVIKPLQSEEYDIDLVCHLELSPKFGQKELYQLVGNCFKESKIYSSILQSKKRCWRLDYANEFHMDILPAIPDISDSSNSILIPDKELNSWHCSNPKDYVEWFYKEMQPMRSILLKEAKVEIEDVPFYQYKTPLQRAIQVLKRNRDILFQNDSDNKPISIIITTLATKAYNNESNLYETLLNLINSMPNQFDNLNGEIAVLNPVNDKENFADKWEQYPERKVKFLNWLENLKYSFDSILKTVKQDLFLDKMGILFGNDIFTKVATKQKLLLEENFPSVTKPHINIISPSKPWKNK